MVKRPKDKNAPRRPLTAFLLYGNYLRANNENIKILPVTQQAASIAQMWRSLDEGEKQKYSREAEKLKEKYRKDVEAYEKSDSYREFQKALGEEKKGKGKKRQGTTRMSGYRLFVKENKNNVDEGLSEEDAGRRHIAKCGKKWKMLSEDERRVYNERAARMNPDQLVQGESGEDD